MECDEGHFTCVVGMARVLTGEVALIARGQKPEDENAKALT